jgi:hypothetical protein
LDFFKRKQQQIAANKRKTAGIACPASDSGISTLHRSLPQLPFCVILRFLRAILHALK